MRTPGTVLLHTKLRVDLGDSLAGLSTFCAKLGTQARHMTWDVYHSTRVKKSFRGEVGSGHGAGSQARVRPL